MPAKSTTQRAFFIPLLEFNSHVIRPLRLLLIHLLRLVRARVFMCVHARIWVGVWCVCVCARVLLLLVVVLVLLFRFT